MQPTVSQACAQRLYSAGAVWAALALMLSASLAGGVAARAAEAPTDFAIEEFEGGEPGAAEGDRLAPPAGIGSDAGPGAPPATAGKQDRSDLVKGRADIRAARRELLEQLYGRLGKARDAIEAEPIVEAIEATWSRTGSDTVDLLMARAGAFVREADLDIAVKILDAVVDLAPDEAEAWHQRAMLHFLRQDYRRCLSDLRRALLLDPRHYKAINALGVVLQEFGDKKAALEAYRKALQVNPYLDSARQSAEELAREVEGQGI